MPLCHVFHCIPPHLRLAEHKIRRWNRYPGARVDSEVPEYELSIPELWKDWTWTTNYPDFNELRAYFAHADKVLDLSRDTAFGSVVVDARFDEKEGRWNVRTEDGRKARAKYLIVAAGFAAKRYVPDWPGIDSFQGMHSNLNRFDMGLEKETGECS